MIIDFDVEDLGVVKKDIESRKRLAAYIVTRQSFITETAKQAEEKLAGSSNVYTPYTAYESRQEHHNLGPSKAKRQGKRN